MRAASLDRRVRKEATLLVREARTALSLDRGLRGRRSELQAAMDSVSRALGDKDMTGVRHGLPVLDALVDDLVKRPGKSTTRDYVESIGAAILIALALRAFVIEAFKIPSSSMYPTLEIGDHIFVNKFLYGVRIPWTQTKFFEVRKPERGEVIVFMQPCQLDKDYIKRVVAVGGDTVEVRCNIVYVNGKAVPSKVVEPACEYQDRNSDDGAWFTRHCSRYEETAGDYVYDTYHDAERPARDEEARAGKPRADVKDFPQSDRIVRNCNNWNEEGAKPAANQAPGEIVVTDENPPNACAQQMHYVVPKGHVFVMGDNRFNSNDSRFWGSVPIENIKGKALFIWLSYSHWRPLDWSGIRWNRIGNFVHP
jgi:signal peptidase I